MVDFEEKYKLKQKRKKKLNFARINYAKQGDFLSNKINNQLKDNTANPNYNLGFKSKKVNKAQVYQSMIKDDLDEAEKEYETFMKNYYGGKF